MDREGEKVMKQINEKIRVLSVLFLSLVLMGLYFLLLYGRFPFIYDINDDVAMRNVAAGVITGEPDAHLIHIKYILGLFISGLYRILPGFDWYGLTMTGIILVAFAMILYRGLISKKSVLWKAGYIIVSLLLFTCVGLQHITAFQWTVTAAIAGAGGIYLFYTSGEGEKFQIVLEEGIAVCLILLSLMVRDDVFLMMLPPAGLCFCWRYISFQRKGKLPFSMRHVGVPLGLLIGTLTILGIEAFAYRSPEWREFLAYNQDREAIMDYYGLASYEEDSEFYDSLGITPEEAENMQRYSLYLVDGLYSEKMHALAERSRELYIAQHSTKARIVEAAESIYEHWCKDTYRGTNLICLAVVAGTLGFCYVKDRKQWNLAWCLTAVTGLYWLYLGYRDRILERVGFALYLLLIFALLAVWYRTAFLETVEELPVREKKHTELIKALPGAAIWAASCLALTLAAFSIWKDVKENNSWRSSYNEEFLDVNRYMAEHMENVYFMTTFSIETYTDNFTIRRDFEFSNLLSVGGWHTFSPLENEKDEKLGIHDPKRDIAEKENVYVISLENVNLRYMDRYFTSIYGENYLGRELTDALDYGERVFEVYDFEVAE